MKAKKITKVQEMCELAGACYNCNFGQICGNFRTLDELPEDLLDAMIANGNEPRKEIDHDWIKRNKDEANQIFLSAEGGLI